MKKFLFATVLALMLGVQSFCSAATIDSDCFNGDDKMIYPVVCVGDAAIDKKINVAIIAEIDRFVTGVYHGAQSIDAEVADIRTNFEIGSNNAGNTVILSIILTESWYYKGAAHPATIQHALNFNTSSGELMGNDYLTDIGECIDRASFIASVEKALIAHCKREGIELFNDALPLKQLPENFYWDENLHLHFIFQHYEVAPYAAGIIDVDLNS